MDTITKAALKRLIPSVAGGSKGNTSDRKALAIALEGAKALGDEAYDYALQLAVSTRKEILQRDTEWQREWGSKVSNRPGRGNHHDSWAMRESYVRCHGSYSDYLAYAHEALTRHPDWETGKATNLPRFPRRKTRI